MEIWRTIQDFPDYVVSNQGEVRHAMHGHRIASAVNQYGVTHIGLTRDGVQYRRALARIVAKAFHRNTLSRHDTVINLNGDRDDCRAENVQWRARWFAIEYIKQFKRYKVALVNEPIRSHDGEVFANSREAAMKFGLLETQIYDSIHMGIYVPPVNMIFFYDN